MDEKRSNKKSAKLQQMAEEEFGSSRKLTHAEQELLNSAATTDVAYGGSSKADADQSNDPADAGNWKQNRNIDAGLIRWLCSERRARDLVDPSGIAVYGARIVGELDLASMVLPFPLSLRKCSFEKNVSLQSLEVPELSLAGSWIRSLSANNIRVKGSIFLADDFHTNGEVDLLGAQIGGNLECNGVKFMNPLQKDVPGSGVVLRADGIVVKGSVFLKGCYSQGEVRLLDAQIGINLECDKGEFVNPGAVGVENSDRALSLDRATIAGDVFLRDGFRAEGQVTFSGAHIGGALFSGGGDFKQATLTLDEASTASVHDDLDSWPKCGNLNLNGFVYRLIEPRNAEMRLKWLALQSDESFFQQPYLLLAKVLAEAGDEKGRIKVLVAMKDREARLKRRNFFKRIRFSDAWDELVWPPLYKATAGYGYVPLRALWEVVGLSALGWILYRRSYLAGGVVPTDKDAYPTFRSSGQPPDHHQRFSPLIYSVENSLPLVKLGQAEKWQPDPSPGMQPESLAGKPTLGSPARWPGWLHWLQRFLVFVGLKVPEPANSPRSRASRWGTSPRFLRWFLWAQILLGWLLATLFLAGVSGIIKKE